MCALEKLNKFLERYVDELKSAKVNLERQLKYLEARGAFRVLGFENFGGFGGDDRGGSDDERPRPWRWLWQGGRVLIESHRVGGP